MKTFSEYEKAAQVTATYGDAISLGSDFRKDSMLNLSYAALGLVGEAGEVANEVKKVIRDDELKVTGSRRDRLADELGDCLWYIAAMAMELGFNMEELAQRNNEKLQKRYSLEDDVVVEHPCEICGKELRLDKKTGIKDELSIIQAYCDHCDAYSIADKSFSNIEVIKFITEQDQ